MSLEVLGTDCAFEIAEDLWVFAEMPGFRPQAQRYAMSVEAHSDHLDVNTVQIVEVAPIHLAIDGGRELPPVQLARIEGGPFKYRLTCGFHRGTYTFFQPRSFACVTM